ncbi:MAG: S41 family peptidase [Rhodospirillaceae bacterium]|nr:S41 family peptidase [Rhodospirillaceae bacterium]
MKHGIAAVLIGAVIVAFSVPLALSQDDSSTDTYRQLDLFATVFERVRADYVEEVSDEELVEAAISGMLASLDPHSSYLNQDSFQDMQVQTRGSFGGLGIEVTMENGVVVVVSPIDDTPAAAAGLEANDRIISIDGEPVLEMDGLSEAVELMRGPVGTDVILTIQRGDQEPFDVSITRDVIRIQSVRYRAEEGGIGYIRISSFTEQTEDGLEDAVANLREEMGDDLIGFVLDLRNNPGGLLDQAVLVADAFLDQGEIVSTRSRHEEDSTRYNARAGDLAEGLPLVVLINGGSASASEIVAGALQDHRRAVLMGTRSFGKGSVQTVVPLPGHGAMRLTTARYYTPSGRSIQALGIDPDIEVHQATLEEVEVQRRYESDLRGALANPNGDPESVDQTDAEPGTTSTEPAVRPFDYQLSRAIDLIRGVSLFAERMSSP